MKRLAALGTAFLFVLVTPALAQTTRQYSRPALPTDDALDRVHLKAGWKTFLPMDSSKDGVLTAQLAGNLMLVQTRSGAVIALNAETGQTLWATRAGLPYRAIYALGHNYNTVFGYNGSYVYALDRTTGKLRWTFDLPNAPCAPPVADAERLYVSMLGGKVTVFDLTRTVPGGDSEPPPAEGFYALKPKEEDKKEADPRATRAGYAMATTQGERAKTLVSYGPLSTASKAARGDIILWQPPVLWEHRTNARVEQAPLLTPRNPDHPGYVFLADVNGSLEASSKLERQIQHRQPADAPVVAPLNSAGDIAYVGYKDGNLFAVNMENGQLQWRYGSSGVIDRRPEVTEEDVYLTPTRGGLVRLNRKDGKVVWRNKDVERFLSASKRFVYGVDRSGQMLILDRDRGTVLSTLDTRAFTVPIPNDQTDRIYLAAHDGMLVSLHDRDNRKPLVNKKFVEDVPPPSKKFDGKVPDKPGEKPEEKPKKDMEKKDAEKKDAEKKDN